ncbi:peptidoglycan-binding domain-containing protein [Streptomyces boluensis]|uniref:Peptidoglycan binding-like domain-containing protein n=1 Tax=Streptomyces boluensis TaxID=1775135 RepID=A0A964UTN6_9ACTN|nr:peptidoglycan-binding domain-containing protein [Streptomyces boluensis]NBE55189.1 hypothetical protein [Streptomyces boluensis]
MSGQSCPGCGTEFLPDFRPACDCALRARQGSEETVQGPIPEPVPEPVRAPRPEPAGRGTAMDPVFGHVASPDMSDTVPNEEVLELFDGPGNGPDRASALPPIGPAATDPAMPEFSRADGQAPSGRGWRYGLLAGAAAVVAVTVGVAGGFFSSDTEQQAGPNAADRVTATEEPTPSETSPTSGESERASRSSKRPTSPSSETGSSKPSSTSTSTSTEEPTGTTAPPAGEQESESESGQEPGTLGRGDRGPEVVELQQRLTELKLYTGPLNGNYGPATENAVTRFQQARQIDEDEGTYGPKTRAAIEAETSDPA